MLLEDVKRNACVAAVNNIIGEESDIDYLFESADANGDGIVMRSEVADNLRSLALLRSGGDKKEKCWTYGTPTYKGYRYFFKCSGNENCSKCTECICGIPDTPEDQMVKRG